MKIFQYVSLRYVWFGFRPFVPGILFLSGIVLVPLPAIFLMRGLRWLLALTMVLLGLLAAAPLSAFAQLRSLSPDIVVDCSASPCTVQSKVPIMERVEPSIQIDATMVASMIWRICPSAQCPAGMADKIDPPSVLGAGNSVTVCAIGAQDTVSSLSPTAINGTSSIRIAAWQCADFISDGGSYLVLLGWQASARQRCPTGQHMVSGTPFACTP